MSALLSQIYPVTVAAGSTIATLGGLGAGIWAVDGDAVIRSDLASTAAGKGYDLVFTKSLLAGSIAMSQHDKNSDFRTLEDFGAIGDGTNHPLSERFSTLTAAQMVYSFVTSLTQSIDWAAATAARNAGGFSILGKKYSLSQTLNITGKTSVKGLGDGLSDFIVTGTGDGIVITLQNAKDRKFWLHLFCNPLVTDTQGRAAISLSYGQDCHINDIYVLQDRAANTIYLDSNGAIFLGAMIGCQVGNIIHGTIANRGSAIIITDGTNDNKFGPIKTNEKYGVSGVGTTQRNSFGPVAPGFGTARFNIASRDLNSFNYDVVSRTDTITLTGPTGGGAAENYFDITPISTLSEVPAVVYVGLAYSDAPSAQAKYSEHLCNTH